MRLRSLSLIALFAIAVSFPAATSFAAKKGAAANQDTKSQDQDDAAQPTSLDNLKDAPKPPELLCSGPFAKDTSHAKLEAAFGAKNVAYKDVELPGNYMKKATVIFDNDPTKRAVFFWRDDKTRANPSSILVEAPSTWSGPGGIRNGLPLKDLEKANGGSFSIVAFGGVNGGLASGLKGPFVNITGGCTVQPRFEPGIANPLPPRYASVTGEQTLVSNNFMLRRVRPQISEWRVNYQ
ncbi:MAG: hypothetical protein J0I29_04715 [Rhizobiales bacterium]|nr:hypothetical protein [Hyphomicrobiales bacterium]